ncbi:MAG TPA: hypothetical protein VI259_19550, partial [Gemmatimonadaceae bacterium]
VSTGTYRALFTRVVYTEWLFFALMAAGLFRLRSRSEYRPAYRVWGYPVVPVVFILSSAYIGGNQIVAEPVQSLMGLAFVAAGFPVYWLFVRRSRPPLPSPTHAD